MDMELQKIIADDVFRYFGRRELSWIEKLLLPKKEVALYCTMAYRKANYWTGHNKRIRSLFWRMRLNSLSRKYFFQIPYPTVIGKGLCIVHFGRIIIAPSAKIGSNCNLFTGVTIGSEVRGSRAGVPTIGDNVWIGPNAALVGRITIGNDVLIAANAYVNFDVPDHSVVIGNPGRVIHKENATKGYISRTV